jgi:uncharacterized protein (DUF1778 family)
MSATKKSELNKKKVKIIRFRISEDEKLLFEQNAILQGYSSVSEFVRYTMQNACWNV